MPSSVKKIVSGGQTGVDRAALDFALDRGFEVGGHVPKGRLAEDGRISDKYPNLVETGSDDTAERTRLNVIQSDATLIVASGDLSGGTKLTETFAHAWGKPFLVLDLEKGIEEAGIAARDWLAATEPETLNVAGPRASEAPAIYELTLALLSAIFDK